MKRLALLLFLAITSLALATHLRLTFYKVEVLRHAGDGTYFWTNKVRDVVFLTGFHFTNGVSGSAVIEDMQIWGDDMLINWTNSLKGGQGEFPIPFMIRSNHTIYLQSSSFDVTNAGLDLIFAVPAR